MEMSVEEAMDLSADEDDADAPDVDPNEDLVDILPRGLFDLGLLLVQKNIEFVFLVARRLSLLLQNDTCKL